MEAGHLLEASLGGQEEGMASVDCPCPKGLKDIIKLVYVLQHNMLVGVEPDELADVLIMFLG